MDNQPADSFNSQVARFLGRRLPEEMAAAIALESLPVEVKRFTTRMLLLMRKACFPATDVTPVLVWQLANVVPGFLPCAWNGQVPPLTLARRNARIDAYVLRYQWQQPLIDPVFVDLGCGFPPVTTVETAAALSDWRLYGVDRFTAEYQVCDPDGHYACFDGQGLFQYFQPTMDRAGIQTYQHLAAARRRFERVFRELHPALGGNPGRTVEKNGYRLVHQPIRDYEAPGLTFIQSEIEQVQIPPARAMRCMNTLIYFDAEDRQRLLVQAGALLADDGILITGANLMSGATCRYTVYRRTGGRLEPVEFAFSVDNLRSLNIMPWYTLHDDDAEALLLADAISRLRADRSFWRAFSGRLDALMADCGLFERDCNGFFQLSEGKEIAPDFAERAARVWPQMEEAGYVEGAVAALHRAGVNAWKNSVGDIALRPPFETLRLPG